MRMWTRALEADEVADLYSSTVQIQDGMVAKYALDYDANDSVGSNNGTVTGATFESAETDKRSIKYDGTGDYVTIPYSTDLVPQEALTVSTWVKFDTLDNYYNMLVWANGTTTAQNSSYALFRFRS